MLLQSLMVGRFAAVSEIVGPEVHRRWLGRSSVPESESSHDGKVIARGVIDHPSAEHVKLFTHEEMVELAVGTP
jgi:hypothetical protein